MRRMHQLPARIEQTGLVREPLHRALAGRGEAVFDLALLLGDLNVDRAVPAFGEMLQSRDRGRRGSAQRMDRESGFDLRPARRLDAPARVPGRVGTLPEASLLGAQCRRVEARAFIE